MMRSGGRERYQCHAIGQMPQWPTNLETFHETNNTPHCKPLYFRHQRICGSNITKFKTTTKNVLELKWVQLFKYLGIITKESNTF